MVGGGSEVTRSSQADGGVWSLEVGGGGSEPRDPVVQLGARMLGDMSGDAPSVVCFRREVTGSGCGRFRQM